MKKILAFVLLINIIFAFSACSATNNSNQSSDLNATSIDGEKDGSTKDAEILSENKKTDSESKINDNSSSLTTSKNNQSNNNSAINYSELNCREIPFDLWETVQIENHQTKIILELDLPKDWKISKSGENSLNITRYGKKIGIITSGNLPKKAEEFDTVCNYVGNSEASMQIARYEENKNDVFYRDYIFSTELNGKIYTTKMHVMYTELDDTAANDILQNFMIITPTKSVPDIAKTNGSKDILILGNSFIYTSKIGAFLNDMLLTSKNDYSAIAVSRGMAQVANYANDNVICDAIEDGLYSYVFICGFYSDPSIQDLYVLKNACQKSNTQLVIFPAHNETYSVIEKTITEHSDTAVLNWKAEINALIDSGVDYYDFCINDTHQHSTPLAGYVGANMIYRSIFKTSPPTLSENAPLTNEYVSSKLNDYIDNGIINNTDIKKYTIK